MKQTMKPTDFFAEFRKPIENAGYKGYKVTNDETQPEIKAFSADRAVTQLFEARVTRVTDQGDQVPSSTDRVASVTRVTQGIERRVTAQTTKNQPEIQRNLNP